MTDFPTIPIKVKPMTNEYHQGLTQVMALTLSGILVKVNRMITVIVLQSIALLLLTLKVLELF